MHALSLAADISIVPRVPVWAVVAAILAAGCVPARPAPNVVPAAGAATTADEAATGAAAPGGSAEGEALSPAPDSLFTPVPLDAAMMLGCVGVNPEASSPVCETAAPSAEEFEAFNAEAGRLQGHARSECRLLGDAVRAILPRVRMYRKALIKRIGAHRYYGVGHAYEIDDVWLVRVARRLDDLNGRTLAELNRTLRHEASHTIGATEEQGPGWTAEQYAANCS